MVLDATGREAQHLVVFTNAGQIGPKPALQRFGDELLTILGAEDQMDVVLCVAVRHASRLQRSGILSRPLPPLRGGLGSFAPPALFIVVSEHRRWPRVSVSCNHSATPGWSGLIRGSHQQRLFVFHRGAKQANHLKCIPLEKVAPLPKPT